MFVHFALIAFACASPTPLAARSTTPSTADTAALLRDRALAGGSVAMDVLHSLTSEVGPRPVGSIGMMRARDWALKKLTSLGFHNVHAEEFIKQDAWLRGAESASMTAPYVLPLSFIGLGNSVPTPSAGIHAEVTVFRSFEELDAAALGSLAGRIALVNQPMVRTQNGEGYGSAVRVRSAGPSVAAARGAVAFLTRSIATGNGRAPHTGATRYSSDVVRIPAAALGVADADLIASLAARGPVRLSLSMSSSVTAQAPAWNVVGEVHAAPRSTKDAADTIIIGGHLDSWDPGQGANDDGAGVAITIAAARLLADGPRLQRNVRVVLFGSEETGGSGAAYAKAHVDELPRFVCAAESDSGQGPLYRLALPKGVAAQPALFGLATTLAPLRVFVSRDAAESGGSDVEELQEAGVPIVDFGADFTQYFDIHHSADDTFDRIIAAHLNQSVAAWAVVLLFLANSGVDLRPPLLTPTGPAPRP